MTLMAAALLVLSAPLHADEGFVPAHCTVESWCLVRATDCVFTRFSHPQGLWQGHAQYSVLRRAVALCPTQYGQMERRTFLGPVEPIRFSSDVQTTAEKARAEANDLCAVYRADWLAAAPRCQERCR
jgi:hypothetical protein